MSVLCRRALKATAVLVPLFGLQLFLIIYSPEFDDPHLRHVYEIVAEYAEQLDADIIALQEVDGAEAAARVFDPDVYEEEIEEDWITAEAEWLAGEEEWLAGNLHNSCYLIIVI